MPVNKSPLRLIGNLSPSPVTEVGFAAIQIFSSTFSYSIRFSSTLAGKKKILQDPSSSL